MLLLLKWCCTSTETVGLLGTGAEDVHLDFHAATELCSKQTKTQRLYLWLFVASRLRHIIYIYFCFVFVVVCFVASRLRQS